jgi:hypothetical protein
MIAERLRRLFAQIRKLSPFHTHRRKENKVNIAPPPVDEKGDDWEKRGHYYRRALVVTDLPNTVESPWLAKIRYKLPPEVFAGSQHVRPIDRTSVENKWLEQSSDYMAHESNLRERNLREAFQAQSMQASTCETLDRISEREYIDLRIYFEIRAPTKSHLDKITDYVASIAEEEEFSIVSVKYRHLEGLQATSPIARDKIGYGTVVTAETAAAITLPAIWFPASLDLEECENPPIGEHETIEWP